MKKLGFAAIVIVLIVFGMKRNRSRPEPSVEQTTPEINEIVITPKVSEPVVQPAVQSVEKPVENGKIPPHLAKQGYILDPENPSQAIKREIKNGKEVTKTVELAGFEPKYVTTEEALQLLESRGGDDPEAEMKGMHNVDIDNHDGAMLLGKFRDSIKNVELATRLTLPENVADLCLFIDGKKYQSVREVRVDAGGYGIAKLNDSQYLRMMWATDKNRIIHGQLLEKSGEQIVVLKTFSVPELNRKILKELEHCK